MDIERQQLKWFFFPVMVAAAVGTLGSLRDHLDWQAASAVVDALQVAGLLAVAFIPMAIAVAVMRYGLYNLGRIVNRTIVYAILAVLLGLFYSGSVLLLGALLPGSDNPVAVASSTLASAALFYPIRGRIQRLVDRRLYRKGYDPEQTKLLLRDRLRNSIRPEAVARDLLDTANRTLQPTRSGVWIRDDIAFPAQEGHQRLER